MFIEYGNMLSKVVKNMRELWKHFKIEDYDIRIDECGIQQFKANEIFSYQVYQNFVIHYIEQGEGYFIVDDKTYHLSAGVGFIIKQGQHVTYYGNTDSPWKNYWVGFGGNEFDKFIKYTSLEYKPVFKYPLDSNIIQIIKDICLYTSRTADSDMNLFWYHSRVYALLYAMSTEFPSNKQTQLSEQSYDEIAYEFINTNFHKQITINEIASYIGISRSYLYKLFKESYHISPQEFLIQKRMNKAIDLLLHTTKPINIIAKETGYDDQLHFSKAFKSAYGVSPSEFKRIKYVDDIL